MPCYRPLSGYRARGGGIVFARKDSPTGLPMQVPCGQCFGCRKERTRQWALRISHEASQHERNSFLTLTYETDPISLSVDDLQRFFKRLRKSGLRVRYYACGEYGEGLGRPHYHVCLFGEDFSLDRYHWRSSASGFKLFRSPTLEKAWTAGHSEIGDISFESAAYVAGYVQKKLHGDEAVDHYGRCDPHTGEWHPVIPEFAVMSRRPGIGQLWLDRFGHEVAKHDSLISGGREMKPPRFYDKFLERRDPDLYQEIKRRRREAAAERSEDSTPERLATREIVAKAKVRSKRSYEA